MKIKTVGEAIKFSHISTCKMTTTLVFYVDSMPYEAAAVALFKLTPHTECVSLTINEARDRACVEKIIDSANAEGTLKRVLFYGTYWRDENLEYFAEKLSKTATVHVYDYGSPVPEAKQSETIGRFFGGPQKIGLATFTSTFLEEHKLLDAMLHTTILNFSAPALKLIDDRTFNINQTESEVMFSGMYAVGSPDGKLIDKFVDLFTGKLRFEDVMKLGKTVVEVRINLARARVLHNSRKIVLADGTEACITNAPELVNVTHDELHKEHEVPVTITVALNFKGTTTVSLSIRSYDKAINAGALARMIKDKDGKPSGDGNAEAGGGRTNFVLDLPF